MAKFYYQNPAVTVNGVDLSTHIASATVESSFDDIETTSFGSNGKRERIGGLEDGSVSLEFHVDFAAASVDATIWPLRGGTAPITVMPAGTALSATNPRFSGTALITGWSPIDGAVGDLATTSVTWPLTGGWARATA